MDSRVARSDEEVVFHSLRLNNPVLFIVSAQMEASKQANLPNFRATSSLFEERSGKETP
jgi:hypothetical protein